MSHDFAGKVVMVTGGGTGIGAAIVEHFAMAGADVACCYNKSIDAARALAEKIKAAGGREIFPVKVDVTSGAEVRAAVEAISTHFGHSVDILVNNAGDSGHRVTLEEMDEAFWDKLVNTNLKSVFLCTQNCVPAMKANGGGKIINISTMGVRAGVGVHAYSASKAGVETFTATLAKELGPFNITVNAVAPGLTDTRMIRTLHTQESLDMWAERTPLRRIGAPEDIAAAVSFLASDDASFITGALIPVNGGLLTS
jgi:3-oxoacyl-[acyl-carrier protein] reductase